MFDNAMLDQTFVHMPSAPNLLLYDDPSINVLLTLAACLLVVVATFPDYFEM